MKRTYQFLAMICCLVASTAQAAASLHHKPFAGLTIARSNYSLKDDMKPYSSVLDSGWNNSYGAVVGYRWQQFGLQASAEVLHTQTPARIANVLQLKQRGENYAVDGLYFVQLCDRLELKSLAGVGLLVNHLNYNENSAASFKKHTHGFGARVGTGLQYQFTDHIIGDAMVKAQVPGNKLFKNVVGVSLGLGYVF